MARRPKAKSRSATRADGATIADLRRRLETAEDTLHAIRSGAIDALIVDDGTGSERIYTLQGADHSFRVLVEQLAQGAGTVALDGTILYCNQRLADLFGQPLGRVLGRSLADFVATAREVLGAAAGQRVERELTVTRGEETIPVLVSLAPLDLSGFLQLSLIVTDLREQKREEEMRVAKETAEEANSAKSAFLANMSHEIRTPLGAMLGFAELLKDPTLRAEDRRDYLDTINRNGRQLGRLIDDILDLSKVEAGRLEIERIPLRVRDELAELEQLHRLAAREKGLKFVVEVAADVPSTVLSDPNRIRQILVNLVGNAIKFTDTGTVTLKVTYDVAAQRLRVLVSDTGPGIAASHLDKLFQPFSQADASTTRRFGGTGLGLALSRRLAMALGGDVQVKGSMLGVGTTFELSVPAPTTDDAHRAASPAVRSLAGIAKDALAGIRVLIAEDAPDNRLLLRRLLGRFGAVVDVVENGEEAVALASNADFDVVLMDLQMPQLDGYGATRELRRRGFEKPIIALTAHAMKEERSRSLDIGCDDHLTKPINHLLLVETVARHAARDRLHS